MGYWFCVLIIPMLLVVAGKVIFKREIALFELILQSLVCVTVAIVSFLISREMLIYDTNFINGEVTGKKVVEVSCDHSYRCNPHQVCTTTRDSNGRSSMSCITEYDTCYRHPYDNSWRVYSNVGKYSVISNVDSQGLIEPKRWEIVKKGDPFSRSVSYKNYLLASPDSVFRTNVHYTGSIPDYPRIYDYYKLSRVIRVDYTGNSYDINTYVNDALKELGPRIQVNIFVVLTSRPETFYPALEQKWIGGKKNDVILIYGIKDNVIQWADTITYGKGQGNRYLIDKLKLEQTGKVFDRDTIRKAIDLISTNYKRPSGEIFRSLMNKAEPSTIAVIISMLANLVIGGMLLAFFAYNSFVFKADSYILNIFKRKQNAK